MGCDIHLYVEERNKNGEWKCASPYRRNGWYRRFE